MWRREAGSETNVELVVNLSFQKCSKSPAFCLSQAFAEGQDLGVVRLLCFLIRLCVVLQIAGQKFTSIHLHLQTHCQINSQFSVPLGKIHSSTLTIIFFFLAGDFLFFPTALRYNWHKYYVSARCTAP